MTTYEAPAKLNLSLLVSPPRADGLHPLESLAQTIEWCDLLEVDKGEGEDSLESDIGDNLVLEALGRLRRSFPIPPLAMRLTKTIPIEAGLGGGSSDAAATLRAGADRGGLSDDDIALVAPTVGADVPFFLTGGSVMMRGVGEQIESVRALGGFAVAVVVPDFGLSTADVYRHWDEMEGPTGETIPDDRLPPALRGGIPIRNDLLPAAIDLERRLGDFMADIRAVWGGPVCLTGSGSACFGFFPTLDEATEAAGAVTDLAVEGRGVELRPVGVRRL